MLSEVTKRGEILDTKVRPEEAKIGDCGEASLLAQHSLQPLSATHRINKGWKTCAKDVDGTSEKGVAVLDLFINVYLLFSFPFQSDQVSFLLLFLSAPECYPVPRYQLEMADMHTPCYRSLSQLCHNR